MKNYEFGVWLVPKSCRKLDFIKHQPHITIMCLKKEEDAIEYCNLLKIHLKNDIMNATIYSESYMVNGSYKDDDLLKSCGFRCYVDDWYTAQRASYLFKNKGVFSYNPHLSSSYAVKKSNLEIKNLDEQIDIKCNIEVVDISDDNPENWEIL